MTTAPLSLEHLIRPSSLKEGKAPVLFMFHGYGSNEEDLFSFAPELPEELCIISVRAPYPLEPFGYAWYAINFDAQQGKWSDDEQAKSSRDKIVAFIDEACATYALDAERVTILGFSQGTILSYAVAISYPEKIKNVVALSGYINEAILKEGYQEKDHSNLKIYASHGQVDQVIPPEWAQKAPEFLKNLDIDHLYEEFPVGHGVAPQNFHSFKKWLEGKI
ncbi:alpha/beta fold hydrolase [Zobellia galactanivorans]|uniref:Carboxylesterase n=1 Tax=Zobellia galactanivorans (strain DSM 12802 / CCUG 47099 / CIP 106680 / NCIMB 13871 / Dsij) TaxID=63186 RepID=G0L2V0_ZOBGA|nr:alpha/beta fold hydrolase [Zobellia galactanivorans]MDO6807787.1 alpha/beta fold hydrolase [Zobellia galactanivorans]CAZ98213.1 Carboxylesterase [Zobellia galactanivorans]